ncbi:MAG TPA: hypothetical protein VGD78_18845 [Chthoniobacterales bacterium]
MKLLFLPENHWKERAAAHRLRLEPLVTPALARSGRHEKHPVYDFLFTYYSFPPAALLRWSPGPGVVLTGESAVPLMAGRKGYTPVEGGVVLKPFPAARKPYLNWAAEYLETMLNRSPQFGCLGLHEWAMVYQGTEVRHGAVPLRLSGQALNAFVEGQSLACTHYDAYRFFTAAARPRNLLGLSRASTTHSDQRGCVHVNMDLYRFCYKIYPWVEGECLAEAFELAAAAREVDMMASPYDLREYGFAPICLETGDGQLEYIRRQRQLSEAAQPIRRKVLTAYRRLLTEG